MHIARMTLALLVLMIVSGCATRALPQHPWSEDNRLAEARWAVQSIVHAAAEGDEVRACRHFTEQTILWFGVEDTGEGLSGDEACMMLMVKLASSGEKPDDVAPETARTQTFAPVDFTKNSKRLPPPEWLQPRGEKLGRRDVLALTGLPSTSESLLVHLRQDSQYDWRIVGVVFGPELAP